MSVEFTPIEEIPKIVESLRQTFLSGQTRSNDFRVAQLKALYSMVHDNFDQFAAAVHKDLRKNKHEYDIFESAIVQTEIVHMIQHLSSWTSYEKPSVSMVNALDGCQIRRDPLGVVLIIGAWNYPVQLTLLPAVAAIAAGNCVVLKPSEVSPNTAQLIGTLAAKYLDPKAFRVVNGAVPETTKVLEQRFDFILYTGNSMIGKVIMTAASKNLTPVGLELGGKSPAVVLDDADLAIAGRRIAWGRYINAGQTCIAPDYILCPASIQPKLIESIKVAVKEFYGENPQESESYGRIVNANHFKRVTNLMGQHKVAFGGVVDESDLYIAPTILTEVDPASPVMQQEIFGPLLPIVNINSVDEAITFINQREKPLALYVFGTSSKNLEKVANYTSSGSLVANDTLVQASVPELPFGGVGNSGTGAYHGKHGFDLFSHKKATMMKDQNLEFVNNIRYPPYTEKKLNLVKTLLHKSLDKSNLPIIGGVSVLGATAAAIFMFMF